MTTPAEAPASGLAGPEAGGSAWHALSADRVLQAEQVDAQRGLSPAEVASRAQRFGPNKFATPRSNRGGTRSSGSTPTPCRSCCWWPAS